jgi:hypothetical protein
MLIGLFAACSLAEAETISHLKLDKHRIPWSHLSFRAKNFWVEVSTEIQMKSLRTSDLDALLLASPKGIPIKPQRSQIFEMTINTIIDPRFRSPVKINNSIWFNPADASALGRIRLRRGEDDFEKMYRFTDRGVFRHRIEPKDKKEASLEPEKWTDVKDSFYPYEQNALKCAGITETSLLIYILSAAATAQLDNGLWLCVFGKRQLHRVQLRPQGFERLEVSYLEKKSNNARQQKRQIKAFKVALTSNPMESVLNDSENFSFFGFHTDITLYVDTTLGLPLRVSGIIPAFGKADLELREVNLRMHTD